MNTRRKMEWADIEAAYTYIGSRAAGIINDGREAFGVALIILMTVAGKRRVELAPLRPDHERAPQGKPLQ